MQKCLLENPCPNSRFDSQTAAEKIPGNAYVCESLIRAILTVSRPRFAGWPRMSGTQRTTDEHWKAHLRSRGGLRSQRLRCPALADQLLYGGSPSIYKRAR